MIPYTIQGAEGDQFGDHVTSLFAVGQKMELPDGRSFRYAEAGETLVANTLQESEVPTAHWITQAIATALTFGKEYAVLKDGGTAIVKAQEGTFTLDAAADLGHIYFIKEQRATGVPAANNTTVVFKDGVHVQVAMAVVGGNTCTFVKNPWMDITQHDGPPNALPCGIPPSIIASGDWGWCQTKGICSCLVDGTVYLGYEVRAAQATNGALEAQSYTEADVANIGSIARVVEVAPTTEYGLFNLFLE